MACFDGNYPVAVEETVDLRLELSAETRAIILPRIERVEAGGALLETSVEQRDGAWHLRRHFVSTERSITPEAYPAIRDVLLRRLEGGSNHIYIADGGEGE